MRTPVDIYDLSKELYRRENGTRDFKGFGRSVSVLMTLKALQKRVFEERISKKFNRRKV